MGGSELISNSLLVFVKLNIKLKYGFYFFRGNISTLQPQYLTVNCEVHFVKVKMFRLSAHPHVINHELLLKCPSKGYVIWIKKIYICLSSQNMPRGPLSNNSYPSLTSVTSNPRKPLLRQGWKRESKVKRCTSFLNVKMTKYQQWQMLSCMLFPKM